MTVAHTPDPRDTAHDDSIHNQPDERDEGKQERAQAPRQQVDDRREWGGPHEQVLLQHPFSRDPDAEGEHHHLSHGVGTK